MKIDKDYFENAIWEESTGEKRYTFKKIADNVGAYRDCTGLTEVWFELDTLENIGGIYESDVRASHNTYYNTQCIYGWDGEKKTRKNFYKSLCTRADYWTAWQLLMDEYKSRKARESRMVEEA